MEITHEIKENLRNPKVRRLAPILFMTPPAIVIQGVMPSIARCEEITPEMVGEWFKNLKGNDQFIDRSSMWIIKDEVDVGIIVGTNAFGRGGAFEEAYIIRLKSLLKSEGKKVFSKNVICRWNRDNVFWFTDEGFKNIYRLRVIDPGPEKDIEYSITTVPVGEELLPLKMPWIAVAPKEIGKEIVLLWDENKTGIQVMVNIDGKIRIIPYDLQLDFIVTEDEGKSAKGMKVAFKKHN